MKATVYSVFGDAGDRGLLRIDGEETNIVVSGEFEVGDELETDDFVNMSRSGKGFLVPKDQAEQRDAATAKFLGGIATFERTAVEIDPEVEHN